VPRRRRTSSEDPSLRPPAPKRRLSRRGGGHAPSGGVSAEDLPPEALAYARGELEERKGIAAIEERLIGHGLTAEEASRVTKFVDLEAACRHAVAQQVRTGWLEILGGLGLLALLVGIAALFAFMGLSLSPNAHGKGLDWLLGGGIVLIAHGSFKVLAPKPRGFRKFLSERQS
jgi:hypothetical protein